MSENQETKKASSAEVGQALREFTVLILKYGKIIGTGFVVSMDGKIVTCAQIVRDNFGVHPRQSANEAIGVVFPQLDKLSEPRQAVILPYFSEHEDDVLLLQLVSKKTPLELRQIAKLGRSDEANGHNFQSYGYREKGSRTGLYTADGTIQGEISLLDGKSRHAKEIQLKSTNIDIGMRGAAVFDEEENLIVGVIAHSPENPNDKNAKESNAVNAYVLSLDPMLLELNKSNPRTEGQRPNQEAPAGDVPKSSSLNYAPNVLDEWVGREDLLAEIWRLYEGKSKRLVGMVGFGGEGKTSLARKWLEGFMQKYSSIPVFWWSFYENRNSDEFLSAFLTFLGGETLGRETNSASQKASYIGSFLGKHEILFVLDGFEVMQHEDSAAYGTLRNRDLLDMLKYAALNDRRSFGLLTTRAPLLDLQPYNTYQHLDISRLSEADGHDLLEKTGVKGSKVEMNKLINDWDGHALTLSLLGKYLAEKFEGDIDHAKDIPAPTSGEDFYKRVTRVLSRYDSHLIDADRAFMQIFSAFRLPVKESAFGKVFRTATNSQINISLLPLDDIGFDKLVSGLVERGLLRKTIEEEEAAYSTHPLIRNHYAQSLQDDTETHRAIAEHYQETAPEQVRGRVPTLQELQPYIEIVHHLCQAGAYDEAEEIRWERISRKWEFFIIHKLGAYETHLNILLSFFPNGDGSKEPLLSHASDKSVILTGVGFCLLKLGRMGEAISFYLRSNILDDSRNASTGYQNLSVISLQLGKLEEANTYAQKAFELDYNMPDWSGDRKWMLGQGLAFQAWAKAQQNQFDGEEGALALFNAAEDLEKENNSTVQYLYSNRGIFHALSLRRKRDLAYARAITEANLDIGQQNSWLDELSQCRRVLGDLDADGSQFENAQKHYDEAVRLAFIFDTLDVRIEAWLGRGLFYAKYKQEGQAALADLEQAMKPILNSGYRIHEANCRIAFAWAYKNMPNPDIARAKQEAERARDMSIEMNYAWGKEDAEEVLAALEKRE